MRRFLFLLPLLFALPARACLNDRDSDSLAVQAAKFPDTLRVITGRFERNPPLFYQMRIRRESAQLQKSPRDFGLYDDIAVAFDHLHRDDEALQIMQRKRALLPPFNAKNPALKEAWYRYYANAGTFHAHHYLGQKSGDLSEMKTARNMIARAIEIKPNAHFGREKYQLLTMDWIVAVRNKRTTKSFGDFLSIREKWADEDGEVIDTQRMREAVEGLSGLIVLGAAWESADIFDALADSLNTKGGITLSHLALLRTQELLQRGHKSLMPNALNSVAISNELREGRSLDYESGINEPNQKTLNELFPKLRAEAESWNAARQKYMLARLETGVHPDTNSQFWAAWKPAAPPGLEVSWFNEGEKTARSHEVLAWGAGIVLLLLLAGFFLVVRWLFRRFVEWRDFS